MTDEAPRPTASLLHLVWAVPCATALSIPAWLLGQYGLCYSESCGGAYGGPDASSLARSVLLLAIACAVWFLFLRLAPWTANRQLRQGVAIGAAACVALITIALGLLWRFA